MSVYFWQGELSVLSEAGNFVAHPVKQAGNDNSDPSYVKTTDNSNMYIIEDICPMWVFSQFMHGGDVPYELSDATTYDSATSTWTVSDMDNVTILEFDKRAKQTKARNHDGASRRSF